MYAKLQIARQKGIRPEKVRLIWISVGNWPAKEGSEPYVIARKTITRYSSSHWRNHQVYMARTAHIAQHWLCWRLGALMHVAQMCCAACGCTRDGANGLAAAVRSWRTQRGGASWTRAMRYVVVLRYRQVGPDQWVLWVQDLTHTRWPTHQTQTLSLDWGCGGACMHA